MRRRSTSCTAARRRTLPARRGITGRSRARTWSCCCSARAPTTAGFWSARAPRRRASLSSRCASRTACTTTRFRARSGGIALTGAGHVQGRHIQHGQGAGQPPVRVAARAGRAPHVRRQRVPDQADARGQEERVGAAWLRSFSRMALIFGTPHIRSTGPAPAPDTARTAPQRAPAPPPS